MFSLVIASVLVAVPPTSTLGGVPKSTLPQGNKTYTAKVFYEYRAPRGHTHTCTSCGDTWDHSENSTHVCKNCGGSPPTEVRRDRRGNVISTIYLTDSPARPVKLSKTVKIETVSYTPLAQQAPREAIVTTPAMRFVSPVRFKTLDCPNGNCPYVR